VYDELMNPRKPLTLRNSIPYGCLQFKGGGTTRRRGMKSKATHKKTDISLSGDLLLQINCHGMQAKVGASNACNADDDLRQIAQKCQAEKTLLNARRDLVSCLFVATCSLRTLPSVTGCGCLQCVSQEKYCLVTPGDSISHF